VKITLAAILFVSGQAFGQSAFLFTDRTGDVVHRVDDANGNGLIDEPGEIATCFSAANAQGTVGPATPTCIAVRTDGLIAIGDSGLGGVLLLHDLNRDGDCQDPGESVLAAGPGNASGVSLASPSGVAFGGAGNLYIVNAGTTQGSDAIYRLLDLDLDGRFMSAGEILPYVEAPVFGAGNGPYSPQEIAFRGPVGFLRNSSANLHGVYRFEDVNQNGRADDAGEFTTFWDATGQSGITPVAGLPLEIDAARPASVYVHLIATGAVDQIVRLTDLNGDHDAQDPGEAVLVYSNAASGFSVAGIKSLPDGRVLLSDLSGRMLVMLTDTDLDGQFNSPGEAAVFFANSQSIAQDVRQLESIPRVCQANCDLSTTPPVLNVQDFSCFLNAFASGDLYANCDSSGTPPLLNVQDFSCFLNAFAAGCP
jgi:hypothetical protein